MTASFARRAASKAWNTNWSRWGSKKWVAPAGLVNEGKREPDLNLMLPGREPGINHNALAFLQEANEILIRQYQTHVNWIPQWDSIPQPSVIFHLSCQYATSIFLYSGTSEGCEARCLQCISLSPPGVLCHEHGLRFAYSVETKVLEPLHQRLFHSNFWSMEQHGAMRSNLYAAYVIQYVSPYHWGRHNLPAPGMRLGASNRIRKLRQNGGCPAMWRMLALAGSNSAQGWEQVTRSKEWEG